MGVCALSEARRSADRAEIALEVLGNAFLFCGDAFQALLASLTLFVCLTLFGCLHLCGRLDLFRRLDLFWRLDLCRCLDLFGCRAAHNNYCQ